MASVQIPITTITKMSMISQKPLAAVYLDYSSLAFRKKKKPDVQSAKKCALFVFPKISTSKQSFVVLCTN